MKIKMNTELLDLHGKPIADSDGNLTLGSAAANALTLLPIEKAPEGKKVKMVNLALKVCGGSEVELSVDEIKLIMDTVDSFYKAPLLVGRIFHLLDPTTKEK